MWGGGGGGSPLCRLPGLLKQGPGFTRREADSFMFVFYLDRMQPPWGKKRLQPGRGASTRIRNGTASLGAGEPEWWEARSLARLPPLLQHRHCPHRQGRQWPLSAGRREAAPGQRLLAFWLQLLGMAGGQWFGPSRTPSPPPTPPVLGAIFRRSSGRWPPLPLGPRRLENTRARERNWSLRPPSLPPSLPTGRGLGEEQ